MKGKVFHVKGDSHQNALVCNFNARLCYRTLKKSFFFSFLGVFH